MHMPAQTLTYTKTHVYTKNAYTYTEKHINTHTNTYKLLHTLTNTHSDTHTQIDMHTHTHHYPYLPVLAIRLALLCGCQIHHSLPSTILPQQVVKDARLSDLLLQQSTHLQRDQRESGDNDSITTQFVCRLLNVPATCECISGTDLLRQFYVLPH